MKIYLPSWNGDMRLESDGDEGSRLTLSGDEPGDQEAGNHEEDIHSHEAPGE